MYSQLSKAVGLGPGPYWSIRSALKGAWLASTTIGLISLRLDAGRERKRFYRLG